ncbi:hypothetical protein ABH922_000136 [Rhodococcus sp. 27YEA15]|uniref:LpqN/LpqT family lipoprotein n=1 Tax=Rhodococcus sp. 27YEA15 TaxID=3156259 RepID=UPI003C7E73BC
MFDGTSSPRTIAEYLSGRGVECIPVVADPSSGTVASTVLLPGWIAAPTGSFPAAQQVLVNPSHGESGWVSNAVLLHGRLSEHVPADELLECARADARGLPSWMEFETSSAQFRGQAAFFIRGIYSIEDLMLDATSRYVVTESSSGQYLTQLTVTVPAAVYDEVAVDVSVFNLALNIQVR